MVLIKCIVVRLKRAAGSQTVALTIIYHRLMALFLVAFQCQQIVALLVDDLLRNGTLAAHRVNGDDMAFDR